MDLQISSSVKALPGFVLAILRYHRYIALLYSRLEIAWLVVSLVLARVEGCTIFFVSNRRIVEFTRLLAAPCHLSHWSVCICINKTYRVNHTRCLPNFSLCRNL